MARGLGVDGRSVQVDGRAVSVGELTAIPDSVVSLYEYEDDSDTTVAVDSKGSNDADITGATYSTTANVGSLALAHDGSDDVTISQNAVDLSAGGDTDGFGVGGWIYPRSEATAGYFYAFGVDDGNYVGIQDSGASAGNARIVIRVNGTQVIGSHVPFSLTTWQHFYAEVTQSEVVLYKDDTAEATDSHSLDVSQIGSGNYKTGQLSEAAASYADFIADDFAPANDPLSDTELQSLIDRAN